MNNKIIGEWLKKRDKLTKKLKQPIAFIYCVFKKSC